MTTIEQVDESIRNEYIIPFQNKIYDADIPPTFVEQFKTAMMHIAPKEHQMTMEVVERLASKRYNELTFLEVGLMLNKIYSTPFYLMYKSFEEGVEVTKKFDQIQKDFNKMGADFEKRVMKIRATKINLAGIGGNTVPFKPIIAQA